MRKVLGFAVGVLCGALVGVVVGMLLTPTSGAELRARIRAQVEDLIRKGQEAAAAKRTELERQLEAFKQGQPVVLQDSSHPPAA
jgi:gas vesicle protein